MWKAPLGVSLALLLMAGGCTKKSVAPPPAQRTRKPLTKNIDDFLPYQPVTQWVNPLVGTSNSGNVVPGALVPHGAVKLSPDTNESPSSIKGYVYDDDHIQGFSHTHLEGPGGSSYGYSEILVMPTRGEIATSEAGYQSPFQHSTEVVDAGYYAVDLDGPSARAEITASRLCGFHRYTFKGTDPGNILIDVFHSRGGFVDGRVEVVGNQEIRGVGHYQVDPLISIAVQNLQSDLPGTTGERTVYFTAHFSRPFDAFGTWEKSVVQPGGRTAQAGPLGAYATFQSPDQAPIEMQVCLSAIDLDQAEKTFQEEAKGHSFDDAHTAATLQWNKLLNRIQIKGGSDDQQRMFYTSLFHSFFQPVDYTEDGRFWSGEDGKGAVLDAPDWRYYSDDWCMWDTFRTTHPMQLLLEPERQSDVVNSMLVGYERGGWMSKCTWAATGDSRVMISDPFIPIVANAYLKGFDEYDVGTAWNGLYKAATDDVPETLLPGICGYFNQGTPPEYLANGYVSHECDPNQATAMTLEYAFEDWSLSRMADRLGKTTERDRLRQLAGSYRNVFNPAHGFMQGKHSDGSWVEPFDPAKGGGGNDFTEATSWIYSWFVPHDVQGLIALMGGRQAFVDKLDAYFDGNHHDPSNEPGFHTPYLYLYAGAPAKTQQRIRDLLAHSFSPTPGGLPGNDDSGAMSTYYVWGAIGLYPITPGDDTLLIGSPLFDEVTVYLEPNFYDGKTFVIRTENNGPDAPYVQSATLNGMPWTKPWLTFGDVIKGGTLVLTMGSSPDAWGSAPEDAPPSISAQ